MAGVAREIVIGSAHHYNWACIGGSIQHPEKGKQLDLSQDTNQHADITDSYVKLYPSDGYGSVELIRALVDLEKPDAIMFFTDPRYFVWLFHAENEFRTKIPFIYLNIWDDYPAPLYNESFYESCDALMAISKQTHNINKLVLGEKVKDKVLTYIPHGINTKFFFPIDSTYIKYNEYLDFRKSLLGDKKYEFILLYNARNIRRKNTSDIILAWRLFCDKIGKEKSEKCALLMHTQPTDEFGTDLNVVKELVEEDWINIIFSQDRIGVEQMNYLYNIGDATILASSNEGWGLSITESLIVGKMVIGTVTGGIQDQMRFENENGKWIEFDENFCSNHMGTIKKHGEWAIPMYPDAISMVGSIPTPYIHDDRVDFRTIAKSIEECYNLGTIERNKRGESGRSWVMGTEAKFTADQMCQSIIETINSTFNTWKPRKHYDLVKITDYPKKKIRHKILY